MRSIRLADCETLVLSLPEAADRGASAAALCARLGLDWRFVDATRASPGWIGCGLSHVRALRAWDGQRPLLVLEDDVAASDDYAGELEVPADADAVYVGVSRYGAVEPLNSGGFIDMLAIEDAGPGLMRVHNMLSTHAILHLTERWRQAALAAMIAGLADHDRAPDRELALIQSDFNVYALQRPLFYQSAALQSGAYGQRQEASTRTVLTASDVGVVVSFRLQGEDGRVRLIRDGRGLRWVWA